MQRLNDTLNETLNRSSTVSSLEEPKAVDTSRNSKPSSKSSLRPLAVSEARLRCLTSR